MYEQLGQIYVDSDFQSLYPARCGQLALSPGRLALITVMQFAEGLSDRQAADAVRSRIDWKYALGLELLPSRQKNTYSGRGSNAIALFPTSTGSE
jgi:transposase